MKCFSRIKLEIFCLKGYYYFGHYGVDENRRDMFLEHPFYNWTVDWCEKYDQASFDPDYPSLDVSVFLPVVRRVLSRPQYWWNPAHPKAGAVSKMDVDYSSTTTKLNIEGPSNVTGPARADCEETWTCYTLEDDPNFAYPVPTTSQ